MFYLRVGIILLTISIHLGAKQVYAQGKAKNDGKKSALHTVEPSLEERANTAKNEGYLTEQEKMVIKLCNIARLDGNYFIKHYLRRAIKDTHSTSYQNVAKALRNSKVEPPLMPAFSLYKSALVHARDMGISGKTGHVSSCGQAPNERIQQYFPSTINCSENYYVGSGEPLDIVIAFLEGRNDTNSEYLRNILNPQLEFIGVSIQPHKYYCNNAVIDFAQKPELPPGYRPTNRKPVEIYWKDCPPALAKKSKKRSFFDFVGWFKRRK